MRDNNKPLRKAYLTALANINVGGAIPVYYASLPPSIDPDNYIIFYPVNNVSSGTMQTQDTDATIRVEIHTFGYQQNAGNDADDIAAIVFQRLLPNTTSALNLGLGLQCLSTELTDDRTEPFDMQDGRKYARRILTFRHKIFHQ
jgi:hypothetical protein